MSQDQETMLAVIETKDVQTVFVTPNGLDPILHKIATEARSFVADTSTASGRKNIASIAFRVAKTKTYLDSLGKDLVDGLKEIPKKVDANRKSMRDFLDALKDEVRQPLTLWEEEEARKEAALAAAELVKQVERDYELAVFMNVEFDRKKEEERQAKIQAQKEREEAIAREAAEKAQRDAEAKAKLEKEESLRRETEAKLAQERAERRAKELEEEAEKQRVESEKRQAAAAQEAVRKEQERIAEEQRKEREERERREANKKHRTKIDAEAAYDLADLGVNESTAASIVKAISEGKVRHASITY